MFFSPRQTPRDRNAPRARAGKECSDTRVQEKSCCARKKSHCTPTAPALHNPHRVNSFERGGGRGIGRRERKGGECGRVPESGGRGFAPRPLFFLLLLSGFALPPLLPPPHSPAPLLFLCFPPSFPLLCSYSSALPPHSLALLLFILC